MKSPGTPYKDYPGLSALIKQIDTYLAKKYPDFFGENPTHPHKMPVRRSKVVHDNIWGTNRFTWREMVLIRLSNQYHLSPGKPVGTPNVVMDHLGAPNWQENVDGLDFRQRRSGILFGKIGIDLS